MKILLALSSLYVAAVIDGAAVSYVPVVDTLHHPHYAFNYAVNDPVTHDNKAQWEVRDGDVVKGSYSLVEPDGSVRVVNYAADNLRGFNAEVKNIGSNLHPAPVITPVLTKAIATVPHVAPVVDHVGYGFGAAPIIAPIHAAAPINAGRIIPAVSSVTSLGPWSHPWDPVTHSYGGWVPINAQILPSGPYVTIFSKKYVDGKMYKWITGPLSLAGKKLIIKHKH